MVRRDDGLSDVGIVSQSMNSRVMAKAIWVLTVIAEDLIAFRLLVFSFLTRSALTYSNTGVERARLRLRFQIDQATLDPPPSRLLP